MKCMHGRSQCPSFGTCKPSHVLTCCVSPFQEHKWECTSCHHGYDLAAIEAQLLAVVRMRTRAYQTQDLRCLKCKQVRALATLVSHELSGFDLRAEHCCGQNAGWHTPWLVQSQAGFWHCLFGVRRRHLRRCCARCGGQRACACLESAKSGFRVRWGAATCGAAATSAAASSRARSRPVRTRQAWPCSGASRASTALSCWPRSWNGCWRCLARRRQRRCSCAVRAVLAQHLSCN